MKTFVNKNVGENPGKISRVYHRKRSLKNSRWNSWMNFIWNTWKNSERNSWKSLGRNLRRKSLGNAHKIPGRKTGKKLKKRFQNSLLISVENPGAIPSLTPSKSQKESLGESQKKTSRGITEETLEEMRKKKNAKRNLFGVYSRAFLFKDK